MNNLLNKMLDVFKWLAIISTSLIAFLTTVEVLARYLLKQPISGAYEIVEKYFMVCCVFFALSYAYRQGANIRVTFLVRRLPDKVNLIIAYFVQIFSILYGTLLTIATLFDYLRHHIYDRLVLTFGEIPLGPAYMVVPMGLFLMTLLMVFDLWQVKKGQSPLFKDQEEEEFSVT